MWRKLLDLGSLDAPWRPTLKDKKAPHEYFRNKIHCLSDPPNPLSTRKDQVVYHGKKPQIYYKKNCINTNEILNPCC